MDCKPSVISRQVTASQRNITASRRDITVSPRDFTRYHSNMTDMTARPPPYHSPRAGLEAKFYEWRPTSPRYQNSDCRFQVPVPDRQLGQHRPMPHAWRASLYTASRTLTGRRSAGNGAQASPLPSRCQPHRAVPSATSSSRCLPIAYTPRRPSTAAHDMLAPVDLSVQRFRAGLPEACHGDPP
jgi:hypothetical protein